MGLRIAKINQHAVAEILRDKTIVAAHDLGDALMIGCNDLAQVFRVHKRRKCRRTNQVREHHRDLPPLGSIRGLTGGRDVRCGTERLCGRCKRTNSFKKLETSTKWKTHLAEMILREIRQDASIDRVLAEYCLVLCET